MTLAPLQAECLAADSVRHGFFDRRGGVSEGIYEALNCGFGSADAPALVAENRARAGRWLGAREMALNTVHQVHGTQVAVLEAPWPGGRGPRADAQVTRTPGLALAVLSADCAPVLLADPEAGVIGAAHAGWRGALAGVTDAAVEAMQRLGARRQRIRAAIGPCIDQASYEVGPEFRAAFLAADPANAGFFAAGRPPDRAQFDLPGYLAARLAGLGLGAVERLAHDTCAEPERFFSYRRSCHLGEPDYGRLASAIALA